MYAPVPQAIEMTTYKPQNTNPYNNYYSVGAYPPQPQTTMQTPLLKPAHDVIYRDNISSPGINGPLEQRECTDVFWCILFVLCFFAFFAFIGFGYYLGKPAGLLGFYNQDGSMCSTTTFPCNSGMMQTLILRVLQLFVAFNRVQLQHHLTI